MIKNIQRYLFKQPFINFPQYSFAKRRVSKKIKKEDDNNPIYTLKQALKLVRAHSIAPYVESIDFGIILNVDPKHGDQIVRGTAQMPFGLGKSKKLCVFASEYSKSKALEAGADMFVDEEILKNIKNGVIHFEQILATPEGLAKLKPFARILGPKGLMPNVKVGNLVEDEKLSEAIKNAKVGQVQFRVDPGSNIHSPLGKITLTDQQIVGNLKSLLTTLVQKKPDAVKQNYFIDAYLKPTKGPKFRVSVESIDPRNKNSQLALFQ